MDNFLICLIHLDKDSVNSGGNLTGQVFVDFKLPREVRSICVSVEGDAYCKWTEGGDNDRMTEGGRGDVQVTYEGKEELLRLETYILGDQAGSNVLFYEAGRYSFPFSFTLPANLPSSLEDDLGHIRYNVKAVIDRSWNWEANSKASFIVKETIDINHPSYCNVKPEESVSKQIGCCFPSGVLSLSGNIDHSAYCNGEAIYVNALVQNQSSTDMRAFKAKLRKKIEYHAQNKNKTKYDVTVLNKIQGPPIPRGQTRMFSNHQLMVETTVPSILNCKVITVSYELSIYVDVPCGLDLDIKIPVVIGTVPRSSVGVASDLNWKGHTPSAPPMEYSDMPQSSDPQRKLLESEMPPSYAAICGQKYINEQNYAKKE